MHRHQHHPTPRLSSSCKSKTRKKKQKPNHWARALFHLFFFFLLCRGVYGQGPLPLVPHMHLSPSLASSLPCVHNNQPTTSPHDQHRAYIYTPQLFFPSNKTWATPTRGIMILTRGRSWGKMHLRAQANYLSLVAVFFPCSFGGFFGFFFLKKLKLKLKKNPYISQFH
ncbi:hypothetical protein B0T24DRAFT_265379 [Lasiosphaeria ovina]|uniref:Transmembrane protein n=1 Tax=Lasiosphaeria ovina TaxID=92902 RepID=A0AAE0N7E5_9PEZI|nr:hypothetical protein B0T24DRAFT_265379 [Lasiosphaeria ovina]